MWRPAVIIVVTANVHKSILVHSNKQTCTEVLGEVYLVTSDFIPQLVGTHETEDDWMSNFE